MSGVNSIKEYLSTLTLGLLFSEPYCSLELGVLRFSTVLVSCWIVL